MYQNDPMKVLTGEVRLSYCNLTTPRASQQGGEPSFPSPCSSPRLTRPPRRTLTPPSTPPLRRP